MKRDLASLMQMMDTLNIENREGRNTHESKTTEKVHSSHLDYCYQTIRRTRLLCPLCYRLETRRSAELGGWNQLEELLQFHIPIKRKVGGRSFE